MPCYVFITCLTKESVATLFGQLVADGHKIGPIESIDDPKSIMCIEGFLGVLLTFQITLAKQAKIDKTKVCPHVQATSSIVQEKCLKLGITTLSCVVVDLGNGAAFWNVGNAQKSDLEDVSEEKTPDDEQPEEKKDEESK